MSDPILFRMAEAGMREYMRPTKRITARLGVGKRPHIRRMAPWHRWYWLDGEPALSVVPDTRTIPIEWLLGEPARRMWHQVVWGDRWPGIAYEAARLGAGGAEWRMLTAWDVRRMLRALEP